MLYQPFARYHRLLSEPHKPFRSAKISMEKNTGIRRLMFAFIYSMQGLYAGIRHESAFRQEFILLIIMATVSFFLDVTALERFAMISVLLAVLIVEALNSAIECVVDRVSTDFHELS
jgi:diacylglycerol kinase (ATP)